MERGTEEPSSGAEYAQPAAATLSEASRESDTQHRSQVPSVGPIPTSSDSTLEEVQRQLAINLARIVQNTVEKETKELLRQIRDNSERQITLLKASLADSWRNPGQTAQLRAALNSEEPWLSSDEALVNIKVGDSGQEPHNTDPSYTLEALRESFEDIGGRDKTAMHIILAVWGFSGHILEDLRDSSDEYPEPLKSFFRDVCADSYLVYTNFPRHMELKLKQGDGFIRMTSPLDDCPLPRTELIRLMMREWSRTSRIESPNYSDLNLSSVQGDPEYGSFDIILAPELQMTDTFMALADMARIISHSAIAAPGGFNSAFAWMAINFLMSFTGPWKPRFGPTGFLGLSKRPRHHCYLKRCMWKLPGRLSQSNSESELKLGVVAMHHTIRFFSPMDLDNCKWRVTGSEGGVQLQRAVGKIENNNPLLGQYSQMNITEKRVSLWVTTSITQPHPVTQGLGVGDSNAWRIAMSGTRNTRHDRDHSVRRCMWYGGIAIFQRALIDVLDAWYKEWGDLLFHLDDVLSVQIEDIFDAEKRASLMFETSTGSKFETSDRYFFVVELLRISAEWVKETGNGLQSLQAEIDHVLSTYIRKVKDKYKGELPNAASREACADVISHNWALVFQAYEKYEKNLLDRIERKAQEVKSLRDGLFSATSVREATKSTSINEYILVFTVMTIAYLPLGFVAGLYGIAMFDFETPGQTRSFIITTVVVSLVTYLAAWGLLYGVRQRRKKGSFSNLLSGPRGWVGLAADMTKRVFNARNGSKPAAEFSDKPKTEASIDREPPPERSEMDERKGRNMEASFRKMYLSWNVISGWPIRRRQHQEAGV